ncbi:MAG: polysaccharide biosynthesis tyrosine autokinase, partial [Desulfobulbaceae bacterium]|nr:polysaccharide biosynthesis tyrosine autokinase [Desulfobulbaceae bacterium]
AQHATKWLHGQIGEKRKNVEKAEQALLKYKQEQHIITDFTSDVEKITAQKLAQLNTRVVDAQSARVEAETRYKQAAAMKGSADMLDSVPEVLNNQLIQQIKSMEAELYKRMAELSKKYGKKHPRMVAVESELRAVRKRKAQEIKRVINSLRNEYKVALARENSLKKAFAEQKEETFGLNQKAIRYSVLRREAESARHMYEMLFNRFKEATLTEDMKTGNIRVVDRAEVQRSPVKPNKKRNILLAIIVGLAMGTGISFFLEYLDNTIQYAEDIEQDLNLPYLGTIPMFTTENNSQNKPGNELITAGSLNSVVSEAYRDIRTNILFSSVKATPQIILVSSALPLEGKSVTAANLAVTMAQAGSKVLIIDCDMRRPKIHKLFSIDMDRGISNLLTGDYNAGRAIVHTKIPNLDVLASGPGVPNATDVLGTKRFDDLLSALRKYYDNIIIDSPPATLLADAVVLSKSVDGIVLVVRAADTAKKIVKNGAEKFLNVGAKILGTVLNGVVLSRYSHYYRYSYYYSDEY